ncbi:MAG: TolC family protein [Myxococcales bacterium]
MAVAVHLTAFAVCFALAAVPSPPSQSGDLPADPVLRALIDESLAVRPEVAQAEATAKAERQRVPQAGAWPEPMLLLGVQNDSFTSWQVGKSETSFYQVMLSQTVPWPGKLKMRAEGAELAASQAERDAARARLSAETDVRRAWLGLVLARDRLDLLARLEGVWQKAEGSARSRYEVGEAAQADLLRAQLELSRLRQRRWGLKSEEAQRLQELNRLRGHALDEPIHTATHLADLALPTLSSEDEAIGDASERSPEWASARLGQTQAERSVALARKSYFPDVTVGLSVMPRGGEFPPMWQVTLGAPLPVFAGWRQGPAIAEAEARAVSRQKAAEAVEQQLRLRVRQRRTALEASLQALQRFRDGLLRQSEATIESTLAQYEVGKVGLLAVLEANAGFLADQEGYLLALAQVHELALEAQEVSLGPVGSLGQAGAAATPPSGAGPSGM